MSGMSRIGSGESNDSAVSRGRIFEGGGAISFSKSIVGEIISCTAEPRRERMVEPVIGGEVDLDVDAIGSTRVPEDGAVVGSDFAAIGACSVETNPPRLGPAIGGPRSCNACLAMLYSNSSELSLLSFPMAAELLDGLTPADLLELPTSLVLSELAAGEGAGVAWVAFETPRPKVLRREVKVDPAVGETGAAAVEVVESDATDSVRFNGVELIGRGNGGI